MKHEAEAGVDSQEPRRFPAQISARDLAPILGIHKRNVEKRATAEHWPFEEIRARGGRQKQFQVKDLPADIQRRVYVHHGVIPQEEAERYPEEMAPTEVDQCAQDFCEAPEWAQQRAEHRLEILKAYRLFRPTFRGPERKAKAAFVRHYKRRQAAGISEEAYENIKTISVATLYEWGRQFSRSGIAGLVSNHGTSRGQCLIPPDQIEIIRGTIALRPNWGSHKIHRRLEHRFGREAVSRGSVQRYLTQLRRTEPTVLKLLESPDKHRNECTLSLGDASEAAQHFLHWVEVDSTPGDCKCCDGKRYNVCGMIDIFSRKCRFIVTPTSNKWAIAALIRAVVLDWGIPHNLKRDRGKDFASKMIRRGLKNIGCQEHELPPFRPELKPFIERVFRTLAEGLFELLPGYVGHNVAERERIRARRSFADRLCKRGQKDKTVEVGLSPRELQEVINEWTENEYHQRRHRIIRMSPAAKAATSTEPIRRIDDPLALHILLAEPSKPERKVGKNGIQFENGFYWSDDLHPYRDRWVAIRYDMQNAGRIYVFDPETKQFICQAEDLALNGISLGDKIAAKKRAAKEDRARAAAMKALSKKAGDPLQDALNAARRNASIRNLHAGQVPTDNPFIDAAYQAAGESAPSDTAAEPTEPEPIFPDSAAEVQPAEEAITKVLPFPSTQIDGVDEQPKTPVFGDPLEKFDWLRGQKDDRELTPGELAWLRDCREEWEFYAEMFSDRWPEADRNWLAEIAPDQFDRCVGES